MTKPVILTGLRANNVLHIGNYLGALLPMVDMAKQKAGEYQINLFVPDLHSFTTPIDHSQLQAGIMNNLRVFVAAGLPLDSPDIHIYRQSFVPAHSELTIILNSFTGFGEMSRMIQFKDKTGSKAHVEAIRRLSQEINASVEKVEELSVQADAASNAEEAIKLYKLAFRESLKVTEANTQTIYNVGEMIDKEGEARVALFDYPVLMAADILLYDAAYVPVGDDQSQHIEFTRDIAERVNSKFGNIFTVPKPVKEQHKFFGKDQGLRIRDLADPTKKMSKSDDSGKGVIFLSDKPEDARKKITSAATDSLGEVKHDYKTRPGVSNLLDLLLLLGGEPKKFIGQPQYGPLKQEVGDKVAKFLEDFQTKLGQVNETALSRKLESSETAMNKIANSKLAGVQKAVGLRP